jgi:hypothetical protein
MANIINAIGFMASPPGLNRCAIELTNSNLKRQTPKATLGSDPVVRRARGSFSG